MTSQLAPTRAARTPNKSGSIAGLAALGVTLVSLAGLIAVRVGDSANWPGFSEGDPYRTLPYVVWDCFAFGALLAPALGIVAVWRGTRRTRPGDVRLGALAISWFLLALLMLVADS